MPNNMNVASFGTSERVAPQIRTGKDGALYINSTTGPVLLSEVNEYVFSISYESQDWHPIRSSLIYAVPTGHSLTLTLTETVVRDDLILGNILPNLESSGHASSFRIFSFQTELEGFTNGYNGEENYQRLIVRGCIPTGDVDITKIKPGEIVDHAWTFRCNANPQIISLLRGNTQLDDSLTYGGGQTYS